MKKSAILFLALFLTMGMLNSCSRSCKGGGWYGDRNLGYVPQKNKADAACDIVLIENNQEKCENAE